MDRCARTRFHDADDRHVERLLREREARRCRGVARDHEQLDRPLREPCADLQHEATDLAQITWSVRAARSITKVDDALIGQGTHDLARDGETAEA